VFGLRLRQVEGLLGSVLPLMGLALAVPIIPNNEADHHASFGVEQATWQAPSVSATGSSCHVAVTRLIFRPVRHLEFHPADAMRRAALV